MRLKASTPLFVPAPPLLLILLLSFALRLYQLGAQSLWYDEAVSLFISQKSISDLIAHTAGDIHPPLYYLLLHFWLAVAGTSEFSVAYFSLFFGVLLVALGFRLARDWFGVNVGLLAAFLITVSSFNLWYSQEVRMYTLVGCIGLLSLLLLTWLWDRGFQISVLRQAQDDNFRFQIGAAGYVLTVVLGLYTHYYFALLWLFQYLSITAAILIDWFRTLVTRHSSLITRHPSLIPWHLIQLAIVVLFLPWLPTAFRQVTEPPVPPWRSFVTFSTALNETLTALAFGQSLPIETGWPLVLISCLLYVLGLVVYLISSIRWRNARQGLRNVLFLFGATFAPFVLLLIASNWVPLYHVRYLFIYAGAFYIVLAFSFAWIARRSLIVMILLLGVYSGGSLRADYLRRFDATYAKDDYRSAVSYMAERVRPGDAVLINAGYIYPAFVYYFPYAIDWRGRLSDYRGDENPMSLVVAQTGSLGASPNLGWGSPTSDFYVSDEPETARALDRLLNMHPRLWVLRANDTVNDPRGMIRRYLSSNAIEFDELTVKGESFVKAQGFLLRRASLPTVMPTEPVSITLGQRIALVGWSAPPTTSAGNSLKLSLFWQSLQPLDVDYRASLGLFDSRGRRWALSDRVPVGSLLPTSDWVVGQVLPDAWNLAVPWGAPPGDYTLQLTLYDPFTQKKLTVPGGVDGTRARLGRIQIVRGPTAHLSAVADLLEALPGHAVFDGALALASYQLTPERVRPGDTIHAELMWHALGAPHENQVGFFQMLDERGRLWAAQESPPIDGRYPTSQWAAGEYVLDPRELVVPADAPDGRYHVIVGWYRERNRERLSVRNGWLPLTNDSLELGMVEVKGRERVMKAPANVGTATRARFGDSAMLIGYDLHSSPASAEGAPTASRTLTVTLYWQALAPMPTRYKVFVHLVGANEQIVTQRDSEPGDGTLPTTAWLQGEYLTDRHTLELDPQTPPGNYSIYIGLYDPRNSVRLTIFDADNKPVGDRWLLRTLTLSPSVK